MSWGPGDLYSVYLPYAVFAILAVDGKVTFAAPIGRWMVGKSLDQVEAWVASKGGRVKRNQYDVGKGASNDLA